MPSAYTSYACTIYSEAKNEHETTEKGYIIHKQ